MLISDQREILTGHYMWKYVNLELDIRAGEDKRK